MKKKERQKVKNTEKDKVKGNKKEIKEEMNKVQKVKVP